ncbi:MAG: NAD(P)H-dependent oxidoreductase [Pseudomonadota bacterium]
MTKLLGLSGSLRAGSFNTMLVKEAAALFAADTFKMGDLRLPLYDGDLEEQGMPAEVERLVEDMRWADAIVMSTPEYNWGPSGVLKNALDWASRFKPAPMGGKPLALVSAAAGMSGGQRAKTTMYPLLIPFGVKMVYTPEVNIGAAHTKFDDQGKLADDGAVKFLGQLMDNLKAAL